MEPVCTAAELERLASRIRDEGVEVSVEAEASRVRLPGDCYARPDEDGQVLGWTEDPDALWYGRFRSVADLLRSARRIRLVRLAARAGVAGMGIWLTHVAMIAAVPGYQAFTRDMGLLSAAVGGLALLGLASWLLARLTRWRMTRGNAGVVWVRRPWQRV